MIEGFKINTFFSDYLLPWMLNAGVALLIFFGGRIAVKLMSRGARKVMTVGRMAPTLINFFCAIGEATLMIVVVIAALDRLGIETTSLIAFLGAAGLAVGLALQGALQNFAAGMMLIMFHPFKKGDYVEAGGGSGFIESIGLFKTVMRMLDNTKVFVPNSNIYSGVIINHTAHKTRRIDMCISISYEDDIRKAKQVIQEVLQSDSRVLQHPRPVVNVAALGSSSIDLNVFPWVRSKGTAYWNVKFDLNEKIKLALDAKGITIPFPQMDVNLNLNKTQ